MTTFKDPAGRAAASDDGDVADPGAADFAARARSLLLESADSLDGRTCSRLARARHAALAQMESGGAHAYPGTRWLVPAGGLAAVAVVAMVWLGVTRIAEEPVQSTGVGELSTSSSLDDMEIMAGTESLELIEDLEFYAWLDAEASGGAG